MSAGWVAAGVRGRGLLRRRVGPDATIAMAALASLDAAVAELEATPYGREVRAGMDLASAQRAVSATLLWHLRVLAGWGPPLGAGPLRVLAGGFEIANITGHLAALGGHVVPAGFDMGSLSTAWPTVSKAASATELRAALGASPWGDPGTEELPTLRLALQLAWARRVFDSAPGAADWAVTATALVVAKVIGAGAEPALTPGATRDAVHLLGPEWQGASTIAELATRLPSAAAAALDGVRGSEDLWRGELGWWSALDTAAAALVARPRPDASTSVGVAARLAADAWMARAALAVAASGGGDLIGVLGGMA